MSPQHVEGLRAQEWMAQPGAASGLGHDPALGAAARVGNSGQRAPQERRAGPKLDFAGPQLWTLFQKTSSGACLLSPRDLGIPWSKHVPGVLARATVSLWLSRVQCAAQLSGAERMAGQLVCCHPRQSGALVWAQPCGRSLILRNPRAVPGAGHWGEQCTEWGGYAQS